MTVDLGIDGDRQNIRLVTGNHFPVKCPQDLFHIDFGDEEVVAYRRMPSVGHEKYVDLVIPIHGETIMDNASELLLLIVHRNHRPKDHQKRRKQQGLLMKAYPG